MNLNMPGQNITSDPNKPFLVLKALYLP